MAAEMGVFIGNEPSALAQFQNWLGKPVDTVLGYTGGQSWGDADPGWAISHLGSAGTKINWSIPMYSDNGGVDALREVAAGKHNADYTHWAQEILASRAGDSDPIYVRTTWELGGEWFHWTADAKADPTAYRAAFQQMAESFHDVSGRFKMVWDFTGDRGPQEQFYPGDAAVDVISQDIYWNPQYSGTDPVAAFQYVQSGMSRGLDWMSNFAAQHGKQMSISEWGAPGWSDGALDGGKFVDLMDNWIDTHNVVFANYWNGTAGSGYDGMLSDGNPAATGAALKAAWADRGGSTPTPTPTTPPPTIPTPAPGSAPTNLTAGTGSDTLVLKISQDAYQGNAQYAVFVDGKQVGGNFTASAKHTDAAGDATDILTIKGEWAPGNHTAEVKFINDAWGGTAATDRNLYVEGAAIDGTAVSGSTSTLLSNGGFKFTFTDRDATTPTVRGVIKGTDAANTLNVGDAKAVNVDAGKGGDIITLGPDHNDVHIILDRGEVRGDHVSGFKSGSDLLEFHGFGQGKVLSLGDGDFKVVGADGKGETFYLDGITTLATQDYIFG